MKSELSPTMKKAIDYMKAHDNKLARYPGGYWAREDLLRWDQPYFRNSTIEKLVKRGLAEYTFWWRGCPIEVTLK